MKLSPDKIEQLSAALATTAPEGHRRSYVDEGPAMAQLLARAAAQGVQPEAVSAILAAFAAEPGAEHPPSLTPAAAPPPEPLIEPLSQRELEVLHLVAQGLSNGEIGGRLFLAVSTVKGHVQRIFDKLGVQRRTEAVARARALGLL